LRRLSRDGPIRGGGAEQVGRQAKSKDKGSQNSASNAQPRPAEAGAVLPSLKDTSWFTHA
jgi:hypothetical protein